MAMFYVPIDCLIQPLNINYILISYQLNIELYFQSLDYRPTSYELKLDDMVITESHKTSVIVLYAIVEI